MLKKVLATVGLIITGLNFGISSSFSVLFLIIGELFGTGLSNRSTALFSLIAALIAAVILYICHYFKKREHEKLSPYVTTLVISFIIGAVIASIFLFNEAGREAYKIG